MTTDDLLKETFSYKSYGRHETFHLRTGWLRKGFEKIKNDPNFFNDEFAIEEFGVGKNMINAIRYWCQAFDVITSSKNGYVQTPFGEMIFKEDKYLEDPFSDWLLHYTLATNFQLAPTFFWAFNYLGLKEFNADNFIRSLNALHTRLGVKEVREASILSDFHIFIQTYCDRSNEKKASDDILDSPFSNLELVMPSQDKRNYRFKIGPKRDLPAELIAYAIVKQMQYRLKSSEPLSNFQINLEALLWEPFSPGMVFKLDGESLISSLDKICQDRILGNAHFSTSAGIKQLIVTCKKLEPINVVNKFYEKAITK